MQSTILQNSVKSIRELRNVVDQADQHKTHTGNELSYDQYCDLLISAANAYDDLLKSKDSKGPTRSIYKNDIVDDVDQYQDCDEYQNTETFNIDTPIDVVQLFTMEHKNFRKPPDPATRLSPESWGQLDQRTRKMWNQLNPEAKRTILGSSNNGSGIKSINNSGPPSNPVHTNLHNISAWDFLKANLHNMKGQKSTEDTLQHIPALENNQEDDNTIMINAMKGLYRDHMDDHGNAKTSKGTLTDRSSLIPPTSPTDIRSLLSTTKTRSANKHVIYRVSSQHSKNCVSLVDRGANGGVAGDDIRIISRTHRKVIIQGIDNHQINDIPIITAGGVISTQRGKVIAIFHQYAYTGKGSSIHSSGQIEWNANKVDDRSIKVGGTQHITTPDGYIIPINIRCGLPRIKLRPYTDDEWEELPHIIMTSAVEWDPSVLDHDIEDDERWYDAISDNTTELKMWDEFGRYRERVEVSHSKHVYKDIHDAVDDSVIYHTYKTHIVTSKYGETIVMDHDIKNPVMIKEQEPNYDIF